MKAQVLVLVVAPWLMATECTQPPAWTDTRRVSRDQACHRIETALRQRCTSSNQPLQFNCDAYYPPQEGCGGDQRETDVERCERFIDRARDCDEALSTPCGVDCGVGPWIPGQER